MDTEQKRIVLCGNAKAYMELQRVLEARKDILVKTVHLSGETSIRIADMKPDLIITTEPDIDQLKAFLRQKERSRINPVPLAVLLQKSSRKKATTYLKAGADEVLDTPATEPLTTARIDAALRGRRRFLELQRANYDSIRLFKLTRKMHATLDIEELIRLVLEEIRALLEVDQVNLLLLEHDQELANKLYVNSDRRLKRRAVKAIINDFRNWLRNLQINENISRKAILKYIHQGHRRNEEETDKLLNIIFSNYLKTKNEFIGIINFLDKDKKEFSQGEIALTSALSQQLAFSIKNILLFETLNFLARKDELTQLFNRRYFNERFNDEFLRKARYGSFFSCIMCDLDHFKQINDSYGHLKGDKVLSEFGHAIRNCIRRIDIAARYGGEEFIILLPETTAVDALTVAERIRNTISAISFGFDAPVTASFGVVCTRSARIENKEDMIFRADAALYHAKRLGRNRTVIYSESVDLTPADKEEKS